jgi:hypothetical protein
MQLAHHIQLSLKSCKMMRVDILRNTGKYHRNKNGEAKKTSKFKRELNGLEKESKLGKA